MTYFRYAFSVWRQGFPDAPTLPTAPSSYTTPTVDGTTVVTASDDSEFRTLLGGSPGSITDVVFNGAEYDNATYVTMPVTWSGVKFWSETVGSALFRYGWVLGGVGVGASTEIHGCSWNIDAVSKAAVAGNVEACISTWGQRFQDTIIEDCTFSSEAIGSDVVETGVGFATAAGFNSSDGSIIRRCTFSDLEENGIGIGGAIVSVDTLPIFEDIDMERIYLLGDQRGESADLGIDNGETGIFTGGYAFHARRCKFVDMGWAGMMMSGDATNPATSGTIQDVWCDYIGGSARGLQYSNKGGVGVYFEWTDNWTLDRMYAGPHMGVAINCEWPGSGSMTPRNKNITIRDVDANCFKFGMLIQYYVDNVDIDRCIFRRSWKAPINIEPNATNITLGNNMSYQLEAEAVSQTPITSSYNGGSLEQPTAGWRYHPDQYSGATEPQERTSAQFHGESITYEAPAEATDWSTLATDLVTGGAGNFTTSGNSNGHMYLQSSLWGVSAKTVAIHCGIADDSSGWLWRQRSAAGPTVQAIALNPIGGPATGITMYVGLTATNWTPDNFPTTWGLDECLISWQTTGTDSIVHFENLTQGTSERYIFSHAALAENSDDHMIICNETQFAAANNQFTGRIYGFSFYNENLDAGGIARDYSSRLLHKTSYYSTVYKFNDLADAGWTSNTRGGASFTESGGQIVATLATGSVSGSYFHDTNQGAYYYRSFSSNGFYGPFDYRARIVATNAADSGDPPFDAERIVSMIVTDPANSGSDQNHLYVGIGDADFGNRAVQWKTTDNDGVSSDTSAFNSVTANADLEKDVRIVRRTTDKDIFDLYWRSTSLGFDLDDNSGWNLIETIDRSDNAVPPRSLSGSADNLAEPLPDAVYIGFGIHSSETEPDLRGEINEALMLTTSD